MFIVHTPVLLITAPFCMVTGELSPSNAPCAEVLLWLMMTLSNTSAVELFNVHAPLAVTIGATPAAPVMEPPLSVVAPARVNPVPVASLNTPLLVVVPASVNVPALILMVPLLVVVPETARVPTFRLTMPVLARLVSVCAVVVVLVSVPALLNDPPAPVIGAP